MTDNSYTKIVKKHEGLKSFVQDSLKNGETASNIGEKIYDKFYEINHFNPEVDKFEKGYKPAKLEARIEAYEPKVESQVVEEKPAEMQITNHQEPSEKVYLTIDELAKLPDAHTIARLDRDEKLLRKMKNENPELVKTETIKYEKNSARKSFYELNKTVLKYVLKDYTEEKAEKIIENYKKVIEETENKNLADLLKKIEESDKDIFMTCEEIALVKGTKGYYSLRDFILNKDGIDYEIVSTGRTGRKPKAYKLTPELVKKLFYDEKIVEQILSAYEKHNQKKSSVENPSFENLDESVKAKVYSDLESVTDEEFFKGCEMKHPEDAKGKQHTNVNIITKKVNASGKEYELKYVFKPTNDQDDNRPVGDMQSGLYETISQISQTMADVAASIFDEEFGFGLFEKTYVKKHPELGIGSVRRYTDPFMSMHEVNEQENQDEIMSNVEECINNRKAFRFIVNEIDTNNQNWGVQIGKNGKNKMKIIDISQSLGIEHNYNKLNSIKKTPELKEKVMKVDEYLLEEKLRKATENFTDFDEQIEGCIERIRKLKEYLNKE